MVRLPYFLEYHRAQGVDRFFFIDNMSTDGSFEYLLQQPDCHVFTCEGSHFDQNVQPPQWLNALLNVYGAGHWSLTLDGDELFIYPHSDVVSIRALCAFLDGIGARGLEAPLIDMYRDGPLMEGRYIPGTPFLDACPYLDAKAPRERRVDDWCPPIQLFGGVRERVFWTGRFARTQPPCLSKVPLVRWQKGMEYIAATHLVSPIPLSALRGGLLHFKFLPGFFGDMIVQIQKNLNGAEKSLQERAAYYAGLVREPGLNLKDEHSVRYENPEQLVALGWLKTNAAYETFAAAADPLARPAKTVDRLRYGPVGTGGTATRVANDASAFRTASRR